MTLKILKAGNGDSMILNFKDIDNKYRNILIDGGNKIEEFHHHILPVLEDIIKKDESIDLMIATHSDADHIKGFQYLFEKIEKKTTLVTNDHIKEIWFNSSYKNLFSSTDISLRDAATLEKYLEKEPFKEKWKRTILQGTEIEFYGAKITILSPNVDGVKQYRDKLKLNLDIASSCDHTTSLSNLIDRLKSKENLDKENLDDKIENVASIAFLFEYTGQSILFLGDANPKTIETALEKLVEARCIPYLTVSHIKLSHHGSIKSISKGILNLVKTDNYIISTNGGKKMPNKTTLAKILMHSPIKDRNEIKFYFNYPHVVKNLCFQRHEEYDLKFKCFEPNDTYGYIFNLD